MAARLACWALSLGLFLNASAAFAADGTAVVHATPAMWTVHGPKGTAYLLGSMHALPDDVQWQTPEIKTAIQRSTLFVFEVPMQTDARERAARLLGENMLLPPSTSLPSYFDSEMRAEFHAAVMHTHVTPEILVRLRPWYAAKLLTSAMGKGTPIFSDQGVDNKVAAIARDRGARFGALETDEFQLRTLMGNATPTNELAILRAAMKQASTMPMTPFNNLLSAWETGDVARLAASGPDLMTPAERKTMLDDRNSAWVPQIEKMLDKPQTVLITVGAGHLVGPKGVPEQLRAAGYRVEGPQGKTEASASAPIRLRGSTLGAY